MNDNYADAEQKKRPSINASLSSYSNRCGGSRIRSRNSSSSSSSTTITPSRQERQRHHQQQQQAANLPPPSPEFKMSYKSELWIQHNTELIRRHSQMILDLVAAGDDDETDSSSCIQKRERGHVREQQQQPSIRDFNKQDVVEANHNRGQKMSNHNHETDLDMNFKKPQQSARNEEGNIRLLPPPPPKCLKDELQQQYTELIRRHSQMILDLVNGDDGREDDTCPFTFSEPQVMGQSSSIQHNNGMLSSEKLAAEAKNGNKKSSFRQPEQQQQQQRQPTNQPFDCWGERRLKASASSLLCNYTTMMATAVPGDTDTAAGADNSELLLQRTYELIQHSQMILNLVGTAASDMGSDDNDKDAACPDQTIITNKKKKQPQTPSWVCKRTHSSIQPPQQANQKPTWSCSRKHFSSSVEQGVGAQLLFQGGDEEEVVRGFGATAAAAAYNVNMTNRSSSNNTEELIRMHSQIILNLVVATTAADDSTPELVQAAVRAASLLLDENTSKTTRNDNYDDESISLNDLHDLNTCTEQQYHHHHHHVHQGGGDIENGIIKDAPLYNDNDDDDDDDNDSVTAADCCTIAPSLMYAYAHHTTHDSLSSGGVVVLADIPQLVDPLEEQEREQQVLDELTRKIPHAIPAVEKDNGGGDDDNIDSRGVLTMILLPLFLSSMFLLAVVVVVSGIAVFARHGPDATQSTAPSRNDEPAVPRGRGIDDSGSTIFSLSLSPSVVPAFTNNDTRRQPPTTSTTVESVMQHGKLRCGVQDFELAYHPDPETCGALDDPETCGKRSMEIDLCRAVAAAIFGNAQQYELVEMQIDERFIGLNNQTVDLYLRAAPTMERDVHEKTTGTGFSFSVPYGYGTVRFGGHSRFVDCADQRNTEGECADLQVCVIKGSLHTEMLGLPQSYLVERELDGMLSGLLHGPCNVAIGHTADLEKALPLVPNHIDVKLGSRVLASEPVAIATRDDDPMWSDLVNWVLLALVHADDLGITQEMASHFPTTMSFGKGFEHMFQYAIASVGTFLEIRNRYSVGFNNIQDSRPRDALHLVSSSRDVSGALLSPDLGNTHSTVGPDPVANGYMDRMIQRGHIGCGITRQRAGFAQQDPQTGEWSGLDVDFCRAVSASLFHGRPDDHLKIVDFDNDDMINDTLIEEAFEALADGRVDILSGMSMSLSRDVFEPSSGNGFSFSLPYYYDNEQLGQTRALVSRQDDGQWSSFVYWTVACTIYAEERLITQSSSNLMPVVKLFGNNFTGMFQDVILHVGNYGEIYNRNLQAYIPRQGLNMLSSDKIGQQLRAISF